MDNNLEIEVESSNTNTNANAQHPSDQRHTLYKAAVKGDWKAAKSAFNLDKNIFCTEITKKGSTALHIAVSAKQTAFVRNVVECLDESQLELKNKDGYTAFFIAAVSGVVEIANVMYEKNKNLPKIRSSKGQTPLEMTVLFGNRKMVKYLYPITPLEDLDDEEFTTIIVEMIHADMLDIAVSADLAKRYTKISTSFSSKTYGESILQALAQKPLSFSHKGWIWDIPVSIIATITCNIPYFKRIYSSLQRQRKSNEMGMWRWEKNLIQLMISGDLGPTQQTQIFHDAAKIGNVEFLVLLAMIFPEHIWKVDTKDYSIFHIAVINRQEKVFGLIYDIGAAKDLNTLYIDENGNNILHLAGEIAPPIRLNIVSGPALQMQRELLWFEEVKKIVRPSYVQKKNKNGQTPRELFTKQHNDLRVAGEKWMKNTTTSCMVVATLIATVAFTAAFTVPGGNKEETGAPIFLTDEWFTVYVISNAVAIFSSTTSVMMFLSILTSRYEEDDFLFTLPAKLMFGLVTLFASIVCMDLTSSATFFLVYKKENQGSLPKLLAALALLPISLYAVLNFRLWIALIHSTFLASRFMFRLGKYRSLYMADHKNFNVLEEQFL